MSMWWKDKSSDTWHEAIDRITRDRVMRQLVSAVGPCGLSPRKDYFVVLVQSILNQQVSIKAAEAMFLKLRSHMPGKRITPTGVYELITRGDEPTIRSCGLSRQKQSYLLDLSQRFINGSIQPRRFSQMNDDALIEHLTQIKGIGRWTVEMVLMFALNRPDVWPVDDLGLRHSAMLHYGLDRDDYEAMNRLGDRFRPYRTVAAWYLWRGRHLAGKSVRSSG
ncbi:MAG: DNA-3-methyladenine glycosylase [Phycisphaerae bacterium]|nr:MAG: DNA-3-methyladenine glycosylase [Phycisphaerae bacterium]